MKLLYRGLLLGVLVFLVGAQVVNAQIATTAAAYGPFCNNVPNSITVAFSTSSSYAGTFKVQLSGPTGAFTNDTTTNIIGSGTSSPLSATIPVGTSGGTGYRVRVLNTRPVAYGSNNGSNITITGTPNAGVISGPRSLGLGNSANYVVSSSAGTWSTSDTTIATISSSGQVVARALGTVNISYSVTNSCSISASSSYPLSVVNQLVVSSIAPAAGLYGTSLTISGSNFNASPTNHVVSFNGVVAPVSSGSSTSLNVVVPSYAGYGALTVTDTVTQLSATTIVPFTPFYTNTGLMTDTVNMKPPVTSGTATYPVGVTSGDFDGDGKMDVVVANSGSNNIYIYRNTGTASSIDSRLFASPFILSAGTTPYFLRAADIDGDGRPEIIVANTSASTNRISIFRNTSTSGTLSFATRVDVSSGGSMPIDLLVTDVDVDGRPDLVITNQLSSRITVLKNNTAKGFIAANSFATPMQFATGLYPFRIAAGDFDGDGKADIAVTNYGSNSISVFRNTSTRGFVSLSTLAGAFSIATGGSPVAIAATDMDADGKADLLVTNSAVAKLSVYKNASPSSGLLAFGAPVQFNTSSTPVEMAVNDIDGDARPDVLVANFYGNNMDVFLNRTSTGTIGTTSLLPKQSFACGINPTGLAVTDLDADGKADVTVVNSGSNTIGVYKNYPLPPVGIILGSDSLCVGSVATYTNSVAGGVWALSNSRVASISSSGVLTALSSGIDTVIYYTVAQQDTNFSYKIIQVFSPAAAGPISGARTVCVGASTRLTATGIGGRWFTSDTAIASVSSSGFVFGRAVGPVVVTCRITNACGTVQDTAHILVTPGSGYTIGAISGVSGLCARGVYTFTDTSVGGTWLSSSATVATVSASGVVTALSQGSTTISYGFTGGCGLYYATFPVTVDTTVRVDSLNGPNSICPGATAILTPYGTLGGLWSVVGSRLSISTLGVVTGITPGNDTVVYTLTNFCGTLVRRKAMSVNLPASAGTVLVADSVCVGDTVSVSGIPPGGVWYRTNPSANIVSGRIVGVSAGLDTLLYVFVNQCGTDTARKVVRVLPLPIAGTITTAGSLCTGSSVTLRASVPSGTWSVLGSNTTLADSTLTAISAGEDTIVYTVLSPFGCRSSSTTKKFTVNDIPLVAPITGPQSVCMRDTVQLLDTTSGGVWSREGTRITVSATGRVIGVSAGLDTVIYSVTRAGCTGRAIFPITVNPLPVVAPIGGASNVCVGSSIVLKNSTPDGVWGSSGRFSVLVDSVLTGTTVGTDTVSYSVTNSCGTVTVTKRIAISPAPYAAPIRGSRTVFVGDTVLLTDSIKGGVWAVRSNNAIINNSGYLGGLKPGWDTVLYVITNSCGKDTALLPIEVLATNFEGTITGFQVYPNPSRGHFTLNLESKVSESIIVVVSDASYRKYNFYTIGTNTPTEIDLLDLAPGMYFFTAITKSRWYAVKVYIAR